MRKRQLTPFGMTVKKRLIEKGMTQIRLAEEIGTSKNYVNLILYGERTGKKYIHKIAAVLDINPDEFRISA
jgi:transcriptional regulator with XRE-family HTH domain